jgi:hypothetical protein
MGTSVEITLGTRWHTIIARTAALAAVRSSRRTATANAPAASRIDSRYTGDALASNPNWLTGAERMVVTP